MRNNDKSLKTACIILMYYIFIFVAIWSKCFDWL